VSRMPYYSEKDDPTGMFNKCMTDYNLRCTQRNAGGKLFWGPMGTPLNRRYCLPTGSHHDNEWIQLVSWKGTIAKDQLITNLQKKQNEERMKPPAYPPMLRYAESGGLELTTAKDIERHAKREPSPGTKALIEHTKKNENLKVYASPLDGHPGKRTARSTSATFKAPGTDDWGSTHSKVHHVPHGRHSASAMGASTMPPMHPDMQQLAFTTGRTLRPKLDDRQRKMWPEHAPQARCNDLGLRVDRRQPMYSISRSMTQACSRGLGKLNDTHGKETWGATQQGWGI